jgi:hypothetical protein
LGGEISIDLGSAIPYLLDEVLGFFGKDAGTTTWREHLQNHIKVGLEYASWVQCIGMEKPLPIAEIYQPTRLKHFGSNGESVEIETAGGPHLSA